jgi:hypothetical protein
VRQINPSGKSISDFQKSCQAPESKIFRWSRPGKSVHFFRVSRPPEGRIAIVTTRWAQDAMDAAVSTANGSAAYGEVVWTWWQGLSFEG